MDILGQDGLEKLIKDKASRIDESAGPQATMPSFIIYRNRFDEQVFVSKAKVFLLATKLLGEARLQVQKMVSARWSRLLRAYRKEPAMENDKDFNRILAGYVAQAIPNLSMLLEDPKTYLVQAELERTQGGLFQYTKLFDDRGALLPMTTLLLMNRRTLLADTKIMLPFWFTLPLFAAIAGFFVRLKAKKKGVPVDAEMEEDGTDGKNKPKNGAGLSTDQLLKNAAAQFQEEKLPRDQTVDQYLTGLEKRWRKILDEDAHKQMARDVQNLVKKKLRQMLAVRTGKQIGPQTIDEMAESIIFETPSFKDLDSTSQMKLYVSAYISKILRG